MAFTRKSAGLVVLMLLLAAVVVSAQPATTRTVRVQNKLATDVKANQVTLKPGDTKPVAVASSMTLAVLDSTGQWVTGQAAVPLDVSKLVVLRNADGLVALVVGGLLGGLIHRLLGTVLGAVLLLLAVLL